MLALNVAADLHHVCIIALRCWKFGAWLVWSHLSHGEILESITNNITNSCLFAIWLSCLRLQFFHFDHKELFQIRKTNEFSQSLHCATSIGAYCLHDLSEVGVDNIWEAILFSTFDEQHTYISFEISKRKSFYALSCNPLPFLLKLHQLLSLQHVILVHQEETDLHRYQKAIVILFSHRVLLQVGIVHVVPGTSWVSGDGRLSTQSCWSLSMCWSRCAEAIRDGPQRGARSDQIP